MCASACLPRCPYCLPAAPARSRWSVELPPGPHKCERAQVRIALCAGFRCTAGRTCLIGDAAEALRGAQAATPELCGSD